MADSKPVTREEQIHHQQRQAAQEAAETPAQPMTETVPGGRYYLDDGVTLVDANGKPVKDAKS